MARNISSPALIDSGRLHQSRLGIVRDVNCLGISHSASAKSFDKRFPQNARAYRAEFASGQIEPGKLFVFDLNPASAKRSLATNAAASSESLVFFNLPARVHWKGAIKQKWLQQCIEETLQAAIEHHVYRLDIYQFEEQINGHLGGKEGSQISQWNEVKLAFLTSFARLPKVKLRFVDRDDQGPRKQVTIFTDGGADPSRGVGGYGIVLRFGDTQKELSQGYLKTTSNRMELLAVINALETLKQPCRVFLHSDCRYVVDSVNTGVVFRWRQKGWKGKGNNSDLWERFVQVFVRHDVEMIWVKGHAGVAKNERCDELASEAMKGSGLIEDSGYQARREFLQKAKDPKAKDPKAKDPKAKDPKAKDPKGQEAKSQATKTQQPKSTKKPPKHPKPKQIGDPCRACGQPLIRRETKKSNPKSEYYYQWYLYCEKCKKLFHVEQAKVYRDQKQNAS